MSILNGYCAIFECPFRKLIHRITFEKETVTLSDFSKTKPKNTENNSPMFSKEQNLVGKKLDFQHSKEGKKFLLANYSDLI